jgi:large-conductance mechanosensitive channel
VIDVAKEWVMNKITMSIVAVGVGNVAAHAKYIDLANTGIGPLSYSGWIAAISCFWIITLILEKWIKWAIELREKFRARQN